MLNLKIHKNFQLFVMSDFRDEPCRDLCDQKEFMIFQNSDVSSLC